MGDQTNQILRGKKGDKEDYYYIKTETASPANYVNSGFKLFVMLCVLLRKWQDRPNELQIEMRGNSGFERK